MELIGKEYKRRLIPVKVQVKSYAKSWCKNDSPITKKIWDKRKCFICHGKFAFGETVTIALTDKGNKLICEKCSNKLLGGLNDIF